MEKVCKHFEKILTTNRLKDNKLTREIIESAEFPRGKDVSWSEPTRKEIKDTAFHLANGNVW